MLILGDGVVGTEFARQTGWPCVSRRKDGLEFTRTEHIRAALTETLHGAIVIGRTDTVVNCVGCVDTFGPREPHWQMNYRFVCDLVDACNDLGIKLVHISADYVHHNSVSNAGADDVPVHGPNWYSYTKLLADAYIELRSRRYLILRGGGLKARPFPYAGAFFNQFGNFGYVDEIVAAFVALINAGAEGLRQVGRPPHSVYDLAIETSHAKPIPAMPGCPTDVTMRLDHVVGHPGT